MRLMFPGKYFLLLSFIPFCSIFFCPSMAFGDWTINTIDSEGNVGENTSIALDSNDKPHIAYYDSSNSKVKYTYWTGSVWKSTSIDWGNLGVGSGESIALDANGNANIIYTYIGSGGLRLAKCTGLSCTTRQIGTIFNADEAVIVLDTANNIRHIAYSDHNASNLKYIKCADSSCSSPETVDSADTAGFDPSIVVDSNGIPHLSYIVAQGKELRYAKKVGSSWIVELVDSNIWQGGGTSLAFDSNGKPYISYNATLGDALKIAWKDQNWQHKNIDGGGLIGEFSSLTFDKNGNFHISYYDRTNAKLKYAKGIDLSWSTYTVHHTEGENVGRDSSIAVDSNGNPHISYKDAHNFDLLYASWSAVTPALTKPEITSVYPNTVIGSNYQQWLTINGERFIPDSVVTVYTTNFVREIPKERAYFVNSSQIRVFANFTTQLANWQVTVTNPYKVVSNTYNFSVTASPADFKLSNPVSSASPLATYISQSYSCKGTSAGCYTDEKYHIGIDISAEHNTPVYPAANGVVVMIQGNGGKLSDGRWADHGYGNTIIVKHNLINKTVYSQYSHLEKIGVDLISACGPLDNRTKRSYCENRNVRVAINKSIGTVGCTHYGESECTKEFGSHLHFEGKIFSTLGTNGDDNVNGEWGYTSNHPDVEGYFNPALYLSETQTVNKDGGIVSYQYITRIVEVKIPANAYQTEKTVNIAQASLPPPIPLSQTDIKMLSSPIAVDINVDGNEQPADYATITMSFQDSDIIGLDKSQLAIARYDEMTGEWKVLESSVDALNNKVTARTNHFSVFAIVQRVIETDLSKARVYPVPFPSPGYQEIMFNHLPANTTLRIYNVAGELVRQLDDNNGDGLITWDARNDSGENVSSGVYFGHIVSGGTKKTLKAVIKR